MSNAPDRPILGCAVSLPGLRLHKDWIFEKQRDLEIQDFCWMGVLDGDWTGLADAIVKELDGYHGRLGIHGPFWGLSIASSDSEVRAVVEKRMHQGLDVCARLKANQMVIHSPFTTWDYYNLDGNPGARGELFDRVHQTLGSVVKRAEDMGCQLVIENIEDKDAHARVDLARSFESAAVQVSIDTGHANYAYGVTGGPPVDYFVHAAGDMLRHVHLQDTDGYADRHWKPGDGTIAWAAVFRALGRLTSRPRLLLELRDHAEIRAGADYIIGLGLAQ
jgi:sugar phosphate isomerase/epimerase